MSSWLFQLAVSWLCLLSCALVLYALRARNLASRILALDTLSLTVVGMLCLIAAHEEQPAYLDLALVVGMVAFIQTLGAVRYSERSSE